MIDKYLGAQVSSASRSAIKSPLDFFIPIFLDADRP